MTMGLAADDLYVLRRPNPCSVKSRPMPSEAAARQDAALAALRHLDAHVRSIMLPATCPQACRPVPVPPRFLPNLQPPEAGIIPRLLQLPSICAHTLQHIRCCLCVDEDWHSCDMPPRALKISQIALIMPHISLLCTLVQMDVSILQTGAGDQPCPRKPAGSTVEFNYWLRVPSAGNALLEAGTACKSTLKTGALAPELDALLDAVGVHGKARCQVRHAWASLVTTFAAADTMMCMQE